MTMRNRVSMLLLCLAAAALPLGAQSRDSTLRADARRYADSVNAVIARWVPDTTVTHDTVTLIPPPKIIHDSLRWVDSASLNYARLQIRAIQLTATSTSVLRSAGKLDSLMQLMLRTPVTTVRMGFNYTTTTEWPVGIGVFPPNGIGGASPVTLCASVMVSGVKTLGSSAMTVTYVRTDSVTWVTRPEMGAALHTVCRIPGVTSPETFPVRWVVRPKPFPLPYAEPVVP